MDIATASGLIAVLVLVLANGFFVASEFALVSVRRTRIDQLANAGSGLAKGVQHTLDHLDGAIAATQLGITMASLALGFIGEPALASLIEPVVAQIPGIDAILGAHAIAIGIAFAIVTSLHIVLGELAPKSLALQRPEATALYVNRPLLVFSTIFRPFIAVLNGAGNMVVRLAGLQPASGHDMVHSVEELELLVESSRQAGVLDEQEAQILGRVFDFGDRSARQIMTPRTEMVAAPDTASFHDLLVLARTSGVTRVPIYAGTPDTVIGLVHLKDLFKAVPDPVDGSAEPFDLRRMLRPILAVPDTVRVEALLTRMRAEKQQITIVVDEFGQTAGVVSLEDILEEIVGDVQDEFDSPRPTHQIVESGEGWAVDGLVDIPTFNDRFGFAIDESAYDTVGGFVVGSLGRLATDGDVIDIGDYRLRVTEMRGKRVMAVRLDRHGTREVAHDPAA